MYESKVVISINSLLFLVWESGHEKTLECFSLLFFFSPMLNHTTHRADDDFNYTF